MATTNGSTMLALESIAPSKTNPRKTFDVAELVTSIKQHGVLQPILVRPLKKNGHSYEIVAGERRWRAAKAAGLEKVPVIVRELDDVSARELQIVENLQRQDVHPMEEGMGYRALLDMKVDGKPLYDVPRIAERVSKSISYIWQRLKLAELIPAGQELFLKGTISTEHAILIARLSEDLQKKTLAETVRKDPTHPQANEAGYVVHSMRQLRQHIFEKVYRSLDKAPFPKDDGTLNPKAPGPQGKCIGCKFNTAATPGLYPDVSGACCAFEPCFETKMAAFLVRKQRELAKETGGEVLAVTRDTKYAITPEKKDKLAGVLTAEQFEETKHNTAGAKKALVVDGRGRGEITYVVPRKPETPTAARLTPAAKKERLEERKVELEGRIENDTARALIAKMGEKAKVGDREFLLDVLAWGIDRSYHTDEIVKILDRIQPKVGWIPKAKGEEATGRVFKESVRGYRGKLEGLKADQLAAVTAVVAGVNARWHDASMYAGSNRLKPVMEAAERLRINVKTVQQQVRGLFRGSFEKLKDAKKKVHDKPKPKPKEKLVLAPGQWALQIKQANGFPRTVAGWKVGDYMGVWQDGRSGFYVSHLPTGYKLGPHGSDTGYQKRETAMYVAEKLSSHGAAWNFLLPAEAQKVPANVRAEVMRLANDKNAAREAETAKKAAPAVAIPAAKTTAAAVTKGAEPVKKNGNGKPNGAVVTEKKGAQATAARKTRPPVKRSRVQASARR